MAPSRSRAGALSIGANTLTLNGLVTVAGGSLTGGASANIVFGGAGATTALPAVTLNNLTIARANGISLAGAVTVGGTLTLTSGNFSVGANTLALDGPPVAGNPASLVTTSSSSLAFDGSASGVVIPSSVVALANLTVNNANGVALNSSPTIGANLTLSAGAFAIGPHMLTLNGAIAATGGSLSGDPAANITFTGTAATTLPAVTLNNLTVNRSGGIALSPTVAVNGTLTLTLGAVTGGGNLTLGNGAAISRATGSLDAAPAFGASVNVTYTGSTAVTMSNEIPANSTVLNNLTVNNSGGVTLAGPVTVNGNVDLSTGGNGNLNTSAAGNYALTVVGNLAVGTGTLVANASTITLGGNFTGTGTFTSGTSTLQLNGTGTQTLPATSGFGSLYNLTINKGAGTASLAGAMTVNNALSVQAGTLDANGLALTVTGLTTVSGGTYLASTATQTLTAGLTVAGGIFTGSSGGVTAGTVTLGSGTLTAPSGAFNVEDQLVANGRHVQSQQRDRHLQRGQCAKRGGFDLQQCDHREHGCDGFRKREFWRHWDFHNQRERRLQSAGRRADQRRGRGGHTHGFGNHPGDPHRRHGGSCQSILVLHLYFDRPHRGLCGQREPNSECRAGCLRSADGRRQRGPRRWTARSR